MWEPRGKKKVVGGMGSGLVGVHLKDELLCETLVNSRRGSPPRVIKCQSIRIQKGKDTTTIFAGV